MAPMKSRYEVVVGNIGTVYQGSDEAEAHEQYRTYINDSTAGYGRVGGETVTLFKNGEIEEEYDPTDDEEL